MKRIGLFLGVEPHAGGMFQYAQSLLNALGTLPASEYRIEIACVATAWRRTLSEYRFPVTWLKAGKLGLQLASASMVAQIPGPLARVLAAALNPVSRQLARIGCDLWIFPAQDAIAYQVRLPVITTVHDLMHRYEPHFPEVVKGRRYQIREHRFRNLASWGRGVLVDSEVGRSHVVDSYGTDPAKVHPLPYVSPRCNRAASSRDFDSRYRLPGKFFFYPAQFWAHKNHAALISAAVAVRKRCPDIHLVFTGDKSHEFERIRAHAAALDMAQHIMFAGYVADADLAGFYARARAMVMPTFFGPTNIPPLEALSCGCPVAVSNIYAMPEQLGDASLYFDPRSIPEMAATLERLWLDDDLCERLKLKGQQQLELWNPSRFAIRLRQILDDILAREA